MTIYKVLSGTTGAYGHGNYAGYLPRGKRPGRWLPPEEPALCQSGYHVCRSLRELLEHLYGSGLYEVEVRGACAAGANKAAYEQVRFLRRIPEWNEETMPLLAVDCARRAVGYAVTDHGLLHAVLDVVVGGVFGYVDDDAMEAAFNTSIDVSVAMGLSAPLEAEWAVRCAVLAGMNTEPCDVWAVPCVARDAARAVSWIAWEQEGEKTAQVNLLARYLAGEQGPFEEEGGSS